MLTTILVLAATALQQDWYTFEPETKNFRVQLPARPNSTSSRTLNRPSGQAQLTTAQLTTADATYSIQVTENRAPVDPNTLDDGMKQFAAANQSTLWAVTKVTVGGSPGRDFELTARSAQGQNRSKLRWVVSGRSLFMLRVAAKPGRELPNDTDRFLGSLEIGEAKVVVASRPETAAPAPSPAAAMPDRGGAQAAAPPKAEQPAADDVTVEVVDSDEDKAKPATDAPEKPAPKKSNGPTKLTISRIPKSAKNYPPESLNDLPHSFVQREREGFRDLGPAGSVLVGVRVSYIEHFGGPKISSVQPIYRSGKSHYLGRLYGEIRSPLVTAFAKPGYAVGGLITHTGLTVDGFRMVFMKMDGDHLDPNDTYNSPWLGDLQGGGPGEVMTKGGLIVGLQGRAGNEVNALGLTSLK